MNLYHLLYEGKAKNAPQEEPKTAFARFVLLIWREGFTLVKLNLLFLLSCLPILTTGPALGALAAIAGKLVRDEPILLWQDYWAAFRKTFWPCFCSGLFLGGCCAALCAAGAAAALLPESVWRYAGISCACAIWLLLCGAAAYLFPLYGETARSAWKKAWILSLSFPQHALPSALLITAAFLLCVLLLPYSLPVILFALYSSSTLAVRFLLDVDLRKT